MAFVPLTSGEIASGQPVLNNTATKIKDNFDNLDGRLTDVETGASTVYPPIILKVGGFYSTLGVYQNAVLTTCNFNLTITGVRLLIEECGSSGTTEIDILYKRGAGAWTSVLTTKPSVTSASGNYALSTNAVLDLDEVSLEAGDLIRLDITSTQAGNAKGFLARIDFNKN